MGACSLQTQRSSLEETEGRLTAVCDFFMRGRGWTGIDLFFPVSRDRTQGSAGAVSGEG